MPTNKKSIKNHRKKRGGILQELLAQASTLAVPVGLLVINEGARLMSPKSKRNTQGTIIGGAKMFLADFFTPSPPHPPTPAAFGDEG